MVEKGAVFVVENKANNKALEWVLKVRVVKDTIQLNLIVKYNDKEYNAIEKIANILEKVYNIHSSRIRKILTYYIRDLYYSYNVGGYIHGKEIEIDEYYMSNLKDYVESIKEDIRKAMSEINKISVLVAKAKSSIPSEYILYTDIYTSER